MNHVTKQVCSYDPCTRTQLSCVSPWPASSCVDLTHYTSRMGRKRKQIDPEAAYKTSLLPCRVCGAPGAGFHYGVNTCEACKGFFHRSLKIWTQYTCDNNDNCSIAPRKSKLCQHCRYQKCLSVGMTKQAIKIGRYTYVKKTKDFLELKSLQENVPNSSHSEDIPNQNFQIPAGSSCNKGGENSLDSNNQSGISSLCAGTCDQMSSEFVFHCSSGIPDSFIPSEDLTVKASLRSSVGQFDFVQAETSHVCATTEETESSASLHENESVPATKDRDLHHLKPHHQDSVLSSRSLGTPLSITSPASAGSTGKSSLIMPGDAPSSSLSFPSSSSPLSTSSAQNSTSLQSPSLNSPATSLSPATIRISSASLFQVDVQTYLSHSSNPVCDMYTLDCDQNIVSDLYSDKDEIVKRLVKADERSLVPVFGNLTDEDIRQQQMEHIEACKLKREVFGQLYKLPDQEYDDFFVTTGLDADDRQECLQSVGVYLEKMIRAMVKFCKAIPGFSMLNIFEKIRLIKYSRQEFYNFIIYRYINREKKIMRGLNDEWKCENEMSRMSLGSEYHVTTEALDIYFKFCQSLQNLKLSHQEMVVIRALIVMAPDRDKPVDSPLVQEIHWQLAQCLIHVLSQRHPNPMFVYAKIMDRLTEARTQTEHFIRFIKELKFDKYSDVMQNPLLREMYGGIFFDDEDDGEVDDNTYSAEHSGKW